MPSVSRRDADASRPKPATVPEAVLVVAAAFGEQVELRRCARAAGDEVDDAGVSVRTVNRRLRAADEVDVVDGLAGDVRKIETAAERVDRDTVDLHQREVGVAAAKEQAGDRAGSTRLVERNARNIPQQVGGDWLVALAHLLAGNQVDTRPLRGYRNIDRRTGYVDRGHLRGNFKLDRGGFRRRDGPCVESGRGNHHANVGGLGRVQFEGPVGRGDGSCDDSHTVHDHDCSAADGRSGWIDNLALDRGSGKAGGIKQAEGRNGRNVFDHVWLLPREPIYSTFAGRSPDLRIVEPGRLPVPSPEQWLV